MEVFTMYSRFALGPLVGASIMLSATVTPSFASGPTCPPPRSPYDLSFECAQAVSQAATQALLEANARARGETLVTAPVTAPSPNADASCTLDTAQPE
jgi:hypothetical protein